MVHDDALQSFISSPSLRHEHHRRQEDAHQHPLYWKWMWSTMMRPAEPRMSARSTAGADDGRGNCLPAMRTANARRASVTITVHLCRAVVERSKLAQQSGRDPFNTASIGRLDAL